jgi:hypothetical protein
LLPYRAKQISQTGEIDENLVLVLLLPLISVISFQASLAPPDCSGMAAGLRFVGVFTGVVSGSRNSCPCQCGDLDIVRR